MTDPTADAAKLLPLFRYDEFGNRGTGLNIGTEEGHVASCENAELADELVRLWNTRPQPAPPEGEPDAIIAELKLAIANAVEGDDPGSVVSVPLVVAQRILDRLSLAARPKVEDADEWLKHDITLHVPRPKE